MPTIFNPLSFFRHVPNALLEQFFSSVPAFTGFDWRVVSEHRVESIYERCNLIPPDESAKTLQPLSGGGITGQSGGHAGADRGLPRR